jgi:hypothetical protein
MLVEGVSADDAKWKPLSQDWSILEIVRHLSDEEVDDFRMRLRLTLETPEKDWPGIDPPRWAIERKYNDGKLEDAIVRFVRERAASVKWLRGLGDAWGVNWSQAHVHPKFGSIRAGDLLTAWVAHDALHLRQIAKRMHQLAQEHGQGFSAAYAGDW